MRGCEHCGGELPTRARRDTRTCSTRCRVASHRSRALPAELTRRNRWVRWSEAKVPLTVDGRPASSTDPGTWSTYERARESDAGVGLGYVLAAGDGVVCLDLDHVLVDSAPTPAAQRLLDRLPATYVEVSPSGDGLHVWGRADVLHGRRLRVGGAAVEVYGAGRYMTMTGRRWGDTPPRLAELSGVVAELT